MIRQNLHTHTVFDDGKNTPMEMAQAALEAGLSSLGFSGHSVLPWDNDWAMTEESERAYIAAVAEAQEWSSKASVPAMEYICPIKGANMATILSMVGTGQYTPEQGIAEIEMDNEIDAQQKGLAGW